MNLKPEALSLKPFEVLNRRWALLVSGETEPNPMTVSWGGFGTIWNKPVVTVYVRPTRFSHGLMNGHGEFTLNFLPARFRKALEICGTLSGRDADKWKEAKITPKASSKIAVPRVKEAALAFECVTVARFDLDRKNFLDPVIETFYEKKDYHTVYIGEVVRVYRK